MKGNWVRKVCAPGLQFGQWVAPTRSSRPAVKIEGGNGIAHSQACIFPEILLWPA